MSGRDDAAPAAGPVDDETGYSRRDPEGAGRDTADAEIMSKPNTERAAAAAPADAEAPERRQNARLRVLVDEMLVSIRESQRRDDWTDDERARAEADLERIMAQVRRAATDRDR